MERLAVVRRAGGRVGAGVKEMISGIAPKSLKSNRGSLLRQSGEMTSVRMDSDSAEAERRSSRAR